MLRFAAPTEGQTTFLDLVRGEIKVDNVQIGDRVVERSDGSPVYQLAVVVDDADMKISHVLRGEDLLSSTPLQINLAAAIGRTQPVAFGHLPLIVGPDRAKLSTRHGPVALADYRDRGFLAEAMVNQMALMGSPLPDDHGLADLGDLLELFEIDRVRSSPALFDFAKLEHLDSQWMQRLEVSDVVERVLPFMRDAGYYEPSVELLGAALPMAVERARTLADIPLILGFLFEAPTLDESLWETMVADPETEVYLRTAREVLGTVQPFEIDSIGSAFKAAATATDTKVRKLQRAPRVALTGATSGPPLWDSMVLLGREECNRRIGVLLERLIDERPNAADAVATASDSGESDTGSR